MSRNIDSEINKLEKMTSSEDIARWILAQPDGIDIANYCIARAMSKGSKPPSSGQIMTSPSETQKLEEKKDKAANIIAQFAKENGLAETVKLAVKTYAKLEGVGDTDIIRRKVVRDACNRLKTGDTWKVTDTGKELQVKRKGETKYKTAKTDAAINECKKELERDLSDEIKALLKRHKERTKGESDLSKKVKAQLKKKK